MLKPLNKNAVKIIDQTPVKGAAEIIVSIVNGKQVYSNADTGELVSMDRNRYTPAYELFNNEKASIVISSLAQGRPLIDALADSSVSKATFSTWLMNNEEFATAVDKARSVRANHVHEKFYANTIEELTGELPEDKADLALHLAKLSAIERRQKILGIQKKEDNPHRFSDKDMNQTMAASVAISIDPDIIAKMQARFASNKSHLDKNGQLDTSEGHKDLDAILEADFKEVK